MGRTRRLLSTAIFSLSAAALLLLIPAGTQAAVTGPNPCPSQPQYSWYGDSVAASQEVPSVTVEGLTYPSSVLRPADTAAFPGKRPVVVIQHGRNGNRCSLWWIAQLMAGHGYVAEIHAAPANPDDATAFTNALDATRSAFAFMKSSGNPAASVSDLTKFGLTGHSLGSAVTAYLQSEPELGVDAVIASDNLRRYIQGDPGGSNSECSSAPNIEVVPTVPALGFAKDEPCNSTPTVTDPDIKQFGWSWWRENAMPSVELVMRGYGHGDFAGGGGEAKKRDLAHWYEAWFDHWLLGEPVDRIVAPQVNGRPTSEILSSHYLSAACLSGVADTTDLSSWLGAGSPKPESGACDVAEEPDPDPDPVDPVPQAKPRLSIKLKGVRRVRAGGKAVFVRVRIHNSGRAAASKLWLVVSSSNRKVRVRKKLRVGLLGPGKTRVVKVRVRARNSARGKAKLRFRARNQRATRTVGVIR